MPDTRVMELADGRELAWMEMGDPAGKPIIGFHGTPGSRRQIAVDEDAVQRAGVRQMAVLIPDTARREVAAGGHMMGLDRTAEIFSTLAPLA
ncbi:MAG TPA: hypothetical protein VG435_10405 [Acidimicrobiales bacterium]|jgi:hypothetical protein|nr:hypothetical protein [Acidimicrobiales bacterium]